MMKGQVVSMGVGVDPQLPRHIFTPLALEQLLDRVCSENNVLKQAVLSRNRAPWLVDIRRQFARQAREQNFSYPQIGSALCRHHTTVMSLLGQLKHPLYRSPRK